MYATVGVSAHWGHLPLAGEHARSAQKRLSLPEHREQPPRRDDPAGGGPG
jgi:hypothetical protein